LGYWSVIPSVQTYGYSEGSYYFNQGAVGSSFLHFGATRMVADRLGFYLQHYIRQRNGSVADGLGGGLDDPVGLPGTIDYKHWNDACVRKEADGITDYAKLLRLYVDTHAAAVREPWGAQWAAAQYPTVRLVAVHILALRQNATANAGQPAAVRGLVRGPAEHDHCAAAGLQSGGNRVYFSVNFWFWRGMVLFGRHLRAMQLDQSLAAVLEAEAAAYKLDIEAAVAAQSVWVAADSLFIPPYVNETGPFSVFTSMVSSTDASYSNFRYYAEMLSSGFLNQSASVGLATFRESHHGTYGGMTRWSDHVDDMPAVGYGLHAILSGRTRFFWALLFGHAANFANRGTFGAAEQAIAAGDIGSNSLREANGHPYNPDVVGPSASLVPLMLRWAVLVEEPDADVVHLLRGAPHRWFNGTIRALRVPTRYGLLSLSTPGYTSANQTLVVQVAAVFDGAGYVNSTAPSLALILKAVDPSGGSVLHGVHVQMVSGASVTGTVHTGGILLTIHGRPTSAVTFTVEAAFAAFATAAAAAAAAGKVHMEDSS
jgi:hypothetical protein